MEPKGSKLIEKIFNRPTYKFMLFGVLIILNIAFLTGCFHQHKWISASCEYPEMCEECEETRGNRTRHSWVDASCEEAKHCEECGKTNGQPLGHDWVQKKSNKPAICAVCDEMKPLSLPKSGKVFIGEEKERISELTITTSSDVACYVKLKSGSGRDVFAFFVRADDSVTVKVPTGSYYVYFAYGTEWYGTEYLFGQDTVYAKDDEKCNFTKNTWSYTLHPVLGGDFEQTLIDAEDF